LEIIYFGSSELSVHFLESLDDSSHQVNEVFVYRDKKRGRGRKVSANPVKVCASARGLKIFEITNFDENFYRELSSVPFDYSIVVSFGMIFPEAIFKKWSDVWINVHPSLLPAYRGPSPMISALLDGAKETGVTINEVVYKVDRGKIYAQTSFNIDESDNIDSLGEKVVSFGAPLLTNVLDLIEKYGYQPRSQSKKGITHTRKITTKDLLIDWTRPPDEIFNRIRAFSTRPGAYTLFKGSRLKVLASSVRGSFTGNVRAGTVMTARKDEGLTIACGCKKTLKLDVIQPQGKKPMDSISFINGYRIKPGIILGND